MNNDKANTFIFVIFGKNDKKEQGITVHLLRDHKGFLKIHTSKDNFEMTRSGTFMYTHPDERVVLKTFVELDKWIGKKYNDAIRRSVNDADEVEKISLSGIFLTENSIQESEQSQADIVAVEKGKKECIKIVEKLNDVYQKSGYYNVCEDLWRDDWVMEPLSRTAVHKSGVIALVRISPTDPAKDRLEIENTYNIDQSKFDITELLGQAMILWGEGEI
jgi:hypothetical protein